MYVLRPSQSIGLKRILGTTIMRVTIMVRSSTRKITTSGTMPQRVCREHVPEVIKHSGLFKG